VWRSTNSHATSWTGLRWELAPQACASGVDLQPPLIASRAAPQEFKVGRATAEHQPRLFPQLAGVVMRARARAPGTGPVGAKLSFVVDHGIMPSSQTVRELARFVGSYPAGKRLVEMLHVTPGFRRGLGPRRLLNSKTLSIEMRRWTPLGLDAAASRDQDRDRIGKMHNSSAGSRRGRESRKTILVIMEPRLNEKCARLSILSERDVDKSCDVTARRGVPRRRRASHWKGPDRSPGRRRRAPEGSRGDAGHRHAYR
jgi:hypothetical protein